MEITVAQERDRGAAQLSARRMALSIGFSGDTSQEIALVVAELASNLVKHAANGSLTLRPLRKGDRTGIEVEAADEGPGMTDIERSVTDGYSTCGTLGYGLGTVNRLMDELDISSAHGSGTRIMCRRWIRPPLEPCAPGAWDIGVATRSCSCTSENGDAFVVETMATRTSRWPHRRPGPRRIRSARCSRGSALRRDSLRPAPGQNLLGCWPCLAFAVQRGILGAGEVRVQVQDFLWDPRWLLLLHTDGLRTPWQWDDFPMIERESPQLTASRLLRKLAIVNDDATVLVVRGNSP